MTAPTTTDHDLSLVVTALMKGVVYRDTHERLWRQLLSLQARVRDYVAVMGLTAVVDEAEGYAYLQSRPDRVDGEQDDDEQPDRVPRLIARRPLSFPVSLLLALLRKKLAEFDAKNSDTRLMLTRDQIVDLMRLFLPSTSNEVRLLEQIDAHLNKVIDLGFARKVKEQDGLYEVRRILKAFVDGQWLSEFDQRLAEYAAHVGATPAAHDRAADDGGEDS